MKTGLIAIILLLSSNIFGHQDTYYKYKYDNVNIIIKTGSFCEAVNNAKIIGQYASILCREYHFKKDVFLYFEHDYIPDNYQLNPIFLSYSDDFIYQIIGFNSDDFGDPESIYMNNKTKLVIQQFGFHYSINETLELLKFGAQNMDFIMNTQKETENIRSYKIKSIDSQIIDSIKIQNSTSVKDIMENKVYISPSTEVLDRHRFSVSYFSQNGEYILFDNNENIIDTLKQIIILKHTSDIVDYIVLLESSEVLKVYSKSIIEGQGYLKSKDHNPQIIGYDQGIFDLRLLILDWDTLLIEFYDFISVYNGMKLIYMRKEDILITDLMEFINSHKKKK